MDKRKRNIQMKFYVDEKELEQINRRVQLANVTNRGAYLRKMAIDGFVVKVDTFLLVISSAIFAQLYINYIMQYNQHQN